jgi:hypothetical protein
MDAKEYRWHVNITKQLYPSLKLTFEQAEQLYLMEQVTKETPRYTYFTDWERLDFELATMRRILSAEQLALYLPDHTEAVAQHVAQIQAQNSSASATLAYHQEVLQFYRSTVLPMLYAHPQIRRAMDLSTLQLATTGRLAFVWQECDQLLRQQWATTVRKHYHQCRDLAEPLLAVHRLTHELQTLWPTYRSLKKSLYKPARLILQAAMKEADYWLPELLAQLRTWQQEWAAHFQQRWEHHHGPIKGFVYEAAFDEKKHRQQWQFILLWLERTAPVFWHNEASTKLPKKPKAT